MSLVMTKDEVCDALGGISTASLYKLEKKGVLKPNYQIPKSPYNRADVLRLCGVKAETIHQIDELAQENNRLLNENRRLKEGLRELETILENLKFMMSSQYLKDITK